MPIIARSYTKLLPPKENLHSIWLDRNINISLNFGIQGIYKHVAKPFITVDMINSLIDKFQTRFNDKSIKYFLWNSYQVNTTTPHWSVVNIDSGNGLEP